MRVPDSDGPHRLMTVNLLAPLSSCPARHVRTAAICGSTARRRQFGVKVTFVNNGITQDVRLSPDDLKAFPKGKAYNLFYALKQEFRRRYKDLSNPYQ